ncbi:GTP-binding protein [archaeon SCG-AAA382B04]|nr:GTP-binding protein [archaeon SCG-AAA382B04]
MKKPLKLIEEGEKENIEFKEILKRDLHLKKDIKNSLASQMKFRILNGNGCAIYLIGVKDNGEIRGLNESEFRETIEVLEKVSNDINCSLDEVEKYENKEGFFGQIKISSKSDNMEHIIVGTAGHVDHGKSSLIGSLVTGEADDGAGKNRVYFDVQPHEIERGLSADLSYGVYGFEKDGSPIRLRNPLNSQERSEIVSKAIKAVSFVDTVGHEPWLRTTIRGIVGQKLDYGLLVIAADDGVTHVTKEHLGILLAMDLPIIVAITKTDLVSEEKVNKCLEETVRLLKKVGKVPYKLECNEDIKTVIENGLNTLIPVIKTSAVTLKNLDLLDKLFYSLSSPKKKTEKPFRMYIDRIYNVDGVGRVVSGTVLDGEIFEGDTVLLGPDRRGDYHEVGVKSIEMHHHRVSEASAGEIIGVSIKGADDVEIKRGMTLCSKELEPKTVREFVADVTVLNHPTKINKGYEPVIHLETISEAAEFEEIKDDYLTAGETAEVRLKFKFNSYYVFKGQKFIFREGESKGIGKVKKIIN